MTRGKSSRDYEKRKEALTQVREEFASAWRALLLDLKRYQPDPETQRRLAEVQDAFEPLIATFDDQHTTETVSDGFRTEHEREQAGAHVRRKQYGRHDKKAVPSGYVYQYGHLFTTRIDFSEPSPEVLLAARELLDNIGGMFVLEADGHAPENLGIIIGKLVRCAKPRPDRVNARARWLQKTRDSLRAHDGRGRRPWESLLEGQLKMDAVHRAAREIREERGDPEPPIPEVELPGELGQRAKQIAPGSFDAPANGAAMLAYLRYCEVEIPDELTAEVVDRMRQRVGLNKGGRQGKKTARSVVAEFAKRLESKRS